MDASKFTVIHYFSRGSEYSAHSPAVKGLLIALFSFFLQSINAVVSAFLFRMISRVAQMRYNLILCRKFQVIEKELAFQHPENSSLSVVHHSVKVLSFEEFWKLFFIHKWLGKICGSSWIALCHFSHSSLNGAWSCLLLSVVRILPMSFC